jgi:hypothetical protein
LVLVVLVELDKLQVSHKLTEQAAEQVRLAILYLLMVAAVALVVDPAGEIQSLIKFRVELAAALQDQDNRLQHVILGEQA